MQEPFKRMLQRAKEVIGRDPHAINLEARIIENSLIVSPSVKFIFVGVDTSIDSF